MDVGVRKDKGTVVEKGKRSDEQMRISDAGENAGEGGEGVRR